MPTQAPRPSRPRRGAALPAQPNQSLIDGLAVLQALAVADGPVGGRELARRLGWNPMRANRLLKTLAYAGLARQAADRRYLPGPGMHALSVQSLHGSGLLRRAVAHVDGLPWRRHPVALGVLWQDQVCYLFHAAAGQPPAAALGSHELYPAARSSIGMALLAWEDEPRVRALYAAAPTIPGHPRGLPSLLADLRKVRRQSYAFVVQHPDPYTASLAVPLGTPPYAALALADVRPEQVESLLPTLRDVATRIGREDEPGGRSRAP